MFYVVVEEDRAGHGPFPSQRIAALWACDHCSNDWRIQGINIPAGMDHMHLEQLQRDIDDRLRNK